MALQRRSRAEAAERARERGALAALVSARRQELGLSQVEVGDLAGVSYRIVHNLESGRTQVTLERALAVLETLGLHLVVERGTRSGVVAGGDVARQYGLDDAGPGPGAVPADGGAAR
jgi:transcriptional regulator with XRE-family HTH domain